MENKYYYYVKQDTKNNNYDKFLSHITDTHMYSQQSIEKPLSFWQLKRKNSVVEKNSQSITNTTRIKTRRNSITTAYETTQQTNRKQDLHQSQRETITKQNFITKRTINNKVNEESRKKLNRFFSNYEISNLIHKRSLLRSDKNIYVEDIEKEIIEAKIKSIQNQQIRYQFNNCNLTQTQSGSFNLKLEKQTSFKSAYQQIQSLTNQQRNKKAPIAQHKMLKQKTKLISNKMNLHNRFMNIIKQVLYVAKYKCRTKLIFQFPIQYNNSFFQNLINGDMGRIKLMLQIEPYLVHSKNFDGQTPLHIACICNNLQLTQLLIQHQSNIEALDSNYLSPLFYSFKAKSNQCFKYLLKNGARPWSPPGGKLALELMTVEQKNHLMHSRLIYIFRIWRIRKQIQK